MIKFGLTNSILLVILLLANSCSEKVDIYNIDEPATEYEYIFSEQGVLKQITPVDRYRELALFDNCLKELDMLDDVNESYRVIEWKGDTILLSILEDQNLWEDIYKSAFISLTKEKTKIGKYHIKYTYEFGAGGELGRPDTIDYVHVNFDNYTLCTFLNNTIKDTFPVNSFFIRDQTLFYSRKKGDLSISKEFVLKGGLTTKKILQYMMLSYKQKYCK